MICARTRVLNVGNAIELFALVVMLDGRRNALDALRSH